MIAYIIGVHQRLNKSAYQNLASLTSLKNFPAIRHINHFEAHRGPDNIKSKRLYGRESIHFYDPREPSHTDMLDYIEMLYSGLVDDLKTKNYERAAFSAAWLAHALTDGMTPAHQFPYIEKVDGIRSQHRPYDPTLRTPLFARGKNSREVIKNNWMLWGAKGLISTHYLFELGVASLVFTHRLKKADITKEDILKARKLGIRELFKKSAAVVAEDFAYEDYYQNGWDSKLARWVRKDLIPQINKVVVLAWYMALKEAGMANPPVAKQFGN